MTRMAPRRIATAALALTLCSGPVIAGGVAASATSTPVVTATLEDDFNGPANTSPDSSKWDERNVQGLFTHKNLARYTSSTANASLDGHGHLRITAIRDTSGSSPTYTSAFVSSKQLVGPDVHIEARIKMAPGYGLWPNFWIQGINSQGLGWPATGEIDIAENPAKLPRELWATAHGLDLPGDDYVAHWKTTTVLNTARPLSQLYHVYGLDVTPNTLTWTIDGIVYKQFSRNELQTGQVWSFDNPYVIIFNLAVGGPFPSNPRPSTKFPSTMYIDWVKVTPN